MEAASNQEEKAVCTIGNTLQELLVQQADIMSQIISNGGELTKEIESKFDSVNLSVAEKIDAYIAVCDRFEMESDYWKSKADQYNKLAKAANTLREKIRSRVKDAMIAQNIEGVYGVERRYQLNKGKDALIIDEALLPIDYKKKEIVYSPDKDRIKMDLELGIPVLGCSIRPTKVLQDYANSPDKKKKKKE